MHEKRGLLERDPRGEAWEAPKGARRPHGQDFVRLFKNFAVVYFIIHCLFQLSAQGQKLWNFAQAFGHRALPPKSQSTKSFTWQGLPTRPYLSYVPCYDGLQCARLELPLDYWNGTTDKTISLAVLKIPATVPVDHPEYRGPILVNPGGPSGSGVELAYRSGPNLQAIVQGDFPFAKERYYDIVGFDPRGVGLTNPPVGCSGSAQWAALWRLRILEEGALTSSDAALGRQWSMMKALSGSCATVGKHNIQRYLTTASVARDMLELAIASTKWQNRQLKKLGSKKTLNPDDTKLQYWGFSYGSYLGNTFAAMFPDRVGRVIVDGVVDAENYAATGWDNNLRDTEKTVQSFYDNCARVGYPACPLADKKDPSPDQIRDRTLAIIQKMWHDPIATTSPYPDVVSWSEIRYLIFASVYSPVASYPYLANVLAELEHGRTSLITGLLSGFHNISCSANQTSYIVPLRNQSVSFSEKDPFNAAAILCSDGDDITSMTQTQFVDKTKRLMSISPNLGDLWSTLSMPCIGYPLRPHYRFTGPWKGKTAHPLLMIGNTADPVTPLWNAEKMARGFEGARVLTQDSPGHCSLAAYSPCTFNYVHEYFFNGTLPDEGTVCDVKTRPWNGADIETMSADEKVQVEAWRDVQKGLLASGGGSGFARMSWKFDVDKLVAVT